MPCIYSTMHVSYGKTELSTDSESLADTHNLVVTKTQCNHTTRSCDMGFG